jgi:hypothetical protein
MKRKLFAFALLFMCLVLISGYLCIEYTKYKMIIFCTLSVPSLAGAAVCGFLAAITYIDHDERKHR